MKKRKFNILLNIAVLCMCVCAIAIGVYSAKTASLNVSGTIGFQAHNCKVNISAYMYGHSLTADGTPVAKPTNDSEKQYLVYGTSNTKATESAPLEINGGSESLSFNINTDSTYKGVYFSDMGESGDLEPITIVLTITNNSNFEVLLEDLTVDSSDYFIICDTPIKVLYTSSDSTKQTTTLTYEVRPAFNDDGTYKEISNANLAISMSFTKTSVNIASTGFTLDESTKSVTGLPTLEQNGGSDILIIPSVFSDKPSVTFTKIGAVKVLDEETNYTVPTDLPNATLYRKIVILDGYTVLGNYSFTNCTNLNYIYIPESLTTWGFNNDELFTGSGLIYLNIPENVSFFFWFIGCEKLKYVNVPESVTTMNYPALGGCSNLQYVKLPKSLKSMSVNGPFSGCSSLKRAEFGDTSKTWTVKMGDGSSSVEISVANPVQNAIYLTSTYDTDTYDWTKNS